MARLFDLKLKLSLANCHVGRVTCLWRIVISPSHMACNIVTSLSLCY